MEGLRTPNQIKIGNFTTSEKEIKDLGKAWVAIGIAFGIVLSGPGLNIVLSIIIAMIAVGLGFLLHELAHKVVAQRYGCWAEFRSEDQFLILAIVMSFFGFVFAAPGAVWIHGPVGKKRNGVISAAGPITNLILATIFLMLMPVASGGFLAVLLFYGLYINAFLAIFNMIPFFNFDGAKIWPWNKGVYFGIVAVAAVYLFVAFAS